MSPENENSEIPLPAEIDQAYNDVIVRSRSNGNIGNLIATLMEATIEANDVIDLGDEETTTQPKTETMELFKQKVGQQKTESEMGNELQTILHEDLFLRIGIKIIPAGSYISDPEGNRVTATSLEPALGSVSLFKSYTDTLTPNNASGSNLLQDIASGLKLRIDKAVTAQNSQEFTDEQKTMLQEIGMDALRAWTELEPSYEKLSVDGQAIKYLNEYPKYWAQDMLSEFIEASNKGYLEVEGVKYGFGPAEWALDMTPSKLLERWNAAIDLMTAVGMKNPESELYVQIHSHLTESLAASVASMQEGLEKAESNGYQKTYCNDNLKALLKVQERFLKQ